MRSSPQAFSLGRATAGSRRVDGSELGAHRLGQVAIAVLRHEVAVA